MIYFRSIPCLIFLCAFVLRVIFLIQYSSSPFFDTPVLDSKYYLETAVNAVNGIHTDDLNTVMSPLYPIFLEYVISLSGEVNYYWIRVVQILIGSASCVFLYFISLHFFSGRIAVLAGALMAAYGPLIFFDNQILTASLVVFFNLASILVLIKSVGKRSQGGMTMLAGVLLGLSVITRPNALLLAMVSLLYLWIYLPKKTVWVKMLCLYSAGIAAAILPVTMTNYARTGEFIPVSSSMGINLYIGNNPWATGLQNNAGGELSLNSKKMFYKGREAAEADSGRALSHKEVSRYWVKRTLRYIKKQPDHFAKNLAKKAAIFWGSYEPANNLDIQFFKARYPFLRWNPITWGGILPFAFLGIGFYMRQRGLLLWSLGVTAVYFFSGLLLFVTARYRLPAVPFLLILAAAGMWGLLDRYRESKKVFMGCALLLLGVFFLIRVPVTKPSFASSHFNLGIIHDHHGRYDLAEIEFREALRQNSDLVSSYKEVLKERKAGGNKQSP